MKQQPPASLFRGLLSCCVALARDSGNVDSQIIEDVASGPLRSVVTFPVYFVNGYKFHTSEHGSGRLTYNSGVCLKGSNYSDESTDYYGILVEIVQLEYLALPIKRVVLFKCDWFDPTPNVGMKVHKGYNLVDVNHKRRFNKYEPFILASQSSQIYYMSYPSLRHDKVDWWAVSKAKPKSFIDLPGVNLAFQDDENLSDWILRKISMTTLVIYFIDKSFIKSNVGYNCHKLKGEGSLTHTGGSISFREHATNLESIYKRPPTGFELYLHTHTSGHDKKTFINEKSKTINENPASVEREVDETALYIAAAGGAKRRNLYGVGSKRVDYIKDRNKATAVIKVDDGWEKKSMKMDRHIKKLNKTLESRWKRGR
ncbi:hypothetical protein CTI12_AA106750 [Artemisia annua]|uniref:DUF4216 domain-containing protein n=1 Tax=Artemisia annua TaxID=35608 RepID=A0A2U1PVX6_ARTAN|nr:hypothetical protein CTI12_AA106750 [Artemisia annua]